VTVLSHIPGRVAIRTCSSPSNNKQSYCVESHIRVRRNTGIDIPTTSSDMTNKLNSFAMLAMASISSLVNTLPTGLCGVFSTIIFVLGVIARLERVL